MTTPSHSNRAEAIGRCSEASWMMDANSNSWGTVMGVAPRASCGPRGSCGKQGSGMQVGRGETKAVPSRLAVVGARALTGLGWMQQGVWMQPGVDTVCSDEKFDTRFAVSS